MSQEQFEEFRKVVLEDLVLQEQIRIFNERESFILRVVELGAERGFDFTGETVREAMRDARREWIERWI
jgi:predicted ribosomally synthesized peptide with nif11-like leader